MSRVAHGLRREEYDRLFDTMTIMSAFSLPCVLPLTINKLFWMRVNRVLAWTLVISPLVQIAVQMPLGTGLAIDLAIFLVHGAMSLVLYGLPKTRKGGFSAPLHAFGFRPRDMSERNSFLVGGYRMAMVTVTILLMFTPIGSFTGWLWVPFLYPFLRMPLTMMQHLYDGARYALRRWGHREHAPDRAMLILFGFLFASIVNLVR